MGSKLRLSRVAAVVYLLSACGGGSDDEPARTVDAARSTLVAAPGTAAADGSQAVTLTATALDSTGAPLLGRLATFTVSGSASVLSASSATTDASGAASVTLTSTVAETKTVSVVIDGVTLAQRAAATFAAGPAATLALSGVPLGATAGEAVMVTLIARDASGNLASGYRGTVRFGSTDPRAVLPADLSFGESDAGQRTVLVQWRSSGTQDVAATDVEVASLTARGTTSVAAAAASRLAFVEQPAEGTAGVLFSPAVRVAVQDAFGNLVTAGSHDVSLALAGGAAEAILSGGGSSPTLDGAVELAALSIDRAGTGYRLAANAAGLTGATSDVFAVAPASPDASASAVAAAPSSPTAGGTTVLSATVRDVFGNPIPGVTVTFSATGDANAITQPAVVTDAAGVATGSLSSTRAEPKTITATAEALQLAAQPVVTFVPGPASAARSSAAAAPSPVVADGSTPSTITVTLLDANDNPVPGDWVILSSSRGAVDAIAASSGETDGSGVVTFSVRSSVSGTSTFTAFDLSAPVPMALTTSLSFVPGPVSADRSTVVSSPPEVNCDGSMPSTVTVTLLDALGNPVPGKEVTLSSSRGASDAIAPASGTSDPSGVVEFTATSSTFGTASFSATDASDGIALVQTAEVSFTGSMSPSRSTVVASPSSVLADGATASTITVTLVDAFGNPVSGEAVTLASSRGADDSISPASGTSDAAGRVTFAVRSSAHGSSSFEATVTSHGLTLTPTAQVAFRSYLVFATQPAASSTSGVPFDPQPVVAARDAAGNTDPGFQSDVTLALGTNPTGATLLGTLTVTPTGGVATFSGVHVEKAGTGYTLVATSPAPEMPAVTSSPFTVVPADPSRLAFAIQPSNTGAGIRPVIQVRIEDEFGNRTTASGLPVTLALGDNPGGATLGGVLTATSAGGIATFAGLTVSANGAGYTLVATDTPDGLTPATSQPFDVEDPAIVGDGTPESCTGAALNAALAAGGHIAFDCGPSPVTITMTSQTNVTVNAGIDGGGLVTLSGGGTTPLFSVGSGTTLALESLGIAAGRTGGNGGAISNGGTLSLLDCTVSSSVATSGYNPYGSPANGGAIFNSGTLLVAGSTFSGNSVSSDRCYYGTSANGGAVFNAGGTVLVVNSTFSGNSASASNAYYGTAGNGGAVFNSGGTLWIVSSTLAGNNVSSSSNYFGVGGQGGAIFGGGTLTSSIVARGTSGANCSGTFVDGGHDIDSDGTCGIGPATDPVLDPAGLSDNGGPTRTIALQAGSPAIETGDGELCAAPPVLGVDQRGYSRPAGGATVCTIGAFEYGSSAPP